MKTSVRKNYNTSTMNGKFEQLTARTTKYRKEMTLQEITIYNSRKNYSHCSSLYILSARLNLPSSNRTTSSSHHASSHGTTTTTTSVSVVPLATTRQCSTSRIVCVTISRTSTSITSLVVTIVISITCSSPAVNASSSLACKRNTRSTASSQSRMVYFRFASTHKTLWLFLRLQLQ